jgi:hypothetical protein
MNIYIYRDKTVEATTPYVEKTTEQVGKVHENMKPTVQAGTHVYLFTYIHMCISYVYMYICICISYVYIERYIYVYMYMY